MAFRRITGLEAQIFVPDENTDAPRKHDCKDCLICQMCSDERCALCLRRSACQHAVLSAGETTDG